jgi:hypothetical protein
MERETKAAAVLMILGFTVLAIPAVMILRGWALTWLWLWFAVPFGLPQISISWGIGLAALVSVLGRYGSSEGKDETKSSGRRMIDVYAKLIMVPLVGLLIGWIAHQFMAAA